MSFSEGVGDWEVKIREDLPQFYNMFDKSNQLYHAKDTPFFFFHLIFFPVLAQQTNSIVM